MSNASQPYISTLHDDLRAAEAYFAAKAAEGDEQAAAMRERMSKLLVGPVTGADADGPPVPVRIGETFDFLPSVPGETPSFMVVAKRPGLLITPDETGDRIIVGALTVDEALGRVMRDNPRLCYEDVRDHFEV